LQCRKPGLVHPNYAHRDYWLCGQSYGDAFVPYLARRLLEGIKSGEMDNKNFKGFAIGNPVFDRKLRIVTALAQYQTLGLLESSSELTGIFSKYWAERRLTEGETEHLHEMQHRAIDPRFWLFHSPISYNYAEHCYDHTALNEAYHIPSEKRAISCFAKDAITKYLNRLDVQQKINSRRIQTR
ncbi:hypothetical protein PMAYCL1PPCAC_25806, partial [Pristionchus mayeri]